MGKWICPQAYSLWSVQGLEKGKKSKTGSVYVKFLYLYFFILNKQNAVYNIYCVYLWCAGTAAVVVFLVFYFWTEPVSVSVLC